MFTTLLRGEEEEGVSENWSKLYNFNSKEFFLLLLDNKHC